MLKYLGVSLIVFFFLSCTKKYYQTEGVYSCHNFFLNYTDSTKLPMPLPSMQSKVWVKDSFLIFEVRRVNEFYRNDTLIRIGFDFYKYTFLNLRTKVCQDYRNLSDTATPVCNYFLGPDESVVWDISSERDTLGVSAFAKQISDTVVLNKILKRIRSDSMPYNPGRSFVYYMDCAMKKNILHLNKKLDDTYPKCQVVMTELIERNSDLRYVVEVKILNEKLQSDEILIFKKWKHNSENIKLPLLTFIDAMKKFDSEYSNSALDSQYLK